MALDMAGNIVKREFFVDAELAFIDKEAVVRIDQQIPDAEKERENEKQNEEQNERDALVLCVDISSSLNYHLHQSERGIK